MAPTGQFQRRTVQLGQVAAELHDQLNSFNADPPALSNTDPVETLDQRVGRAKARWLRRVMYGTIATSTEKCFAYAVADHLNCVTLDAWPGKLRLSRHLGFKSVKTIERAARGLQDLDVLVVRCLGRGQFRYAPIFIPEDENRLVSTSGQHSSSPKDTDVRESLLLIHINSSDPTKRLSEEGSGGRAGLIYRRAQRGTFEHQVAALLGDDGMEVLSRLSSIDDTIVDRLCRAHAMGVLGSRELAAARLAAEQVRLS